MPDLCGGPRPAAREDRGGASAYGGREPRFRRRARKGGDLVREFTFTNDGTVPLVVTRVITSCSCLKASYSKRPVAPGESGTISIIYEPHKSEPGVFNKVIQIYSNSVDGRDVITVQGNSIDPGPRKVKTGEVKIKYKKDK